MVGCPQHMSQLRKDDSSRFDTERAYEFYKDEILGSTQSRSRWYEAYGFRNPRTTSVDWEVFGAVLLRQKRSGNPYGHDLEQAEVKSCGPSGSSFEYQYHKKGGISKLDQEHLINHVYICYSEDYLDVKVYLVRGNDLKPLFDSWRDALVANYKDGLRQRYRKAVPRSIVLRFGETILDIQFGELKAPDRLPTE